MAGYQVTHTCLNDIQRRDIFQSLHDFDSQYILNKQGIDHTDQSVCSQLNIWADSM